MLRLKQGSYVHKAHLLNMEYTVTEEGITANIDSDLILDICLRFLHINKDKSLYFYLETSDEQKREIDVSSDSTARNASVSYRIDFDSFEKASGVLFYFSDLIARDGICRFKFGTQDGDEIESGKYNIVKITSDDIEKYEKIFTLNEIPKVEKLTTAYDTFSKEHPGVSKRMTYKGMTVLDIPDALKAYGLIE